MPLGSARLAISAEFPVAALFVWGSAFRLSGGTNGQVGKPDKLKLELRTWFDGQRSTEVSGIA